MTIQNACNVTDTSKPKPKPKPIRVGTIGGGQLAMMLAEAAKVLHAELVVLVDNPDCPAKEVAHVIVGDQNNIEDLKQFAKQVDVITFEFENVNLINLEHLTCSINPNLSALRTAQDREQEKLLFKKLAIPTTQFSIANNVEELVAAVHTIGLPCVIKTCRDGYDGKGQKLLRTSEPADLVWKELGGKRLIVENLVTFEKEVSLIAVRSYSGEMVFYPLTENQHQDGILRVSKAPYLDAGLQAKAEIYVEKLLVALDYVGVMAVEFFVVGDELIANEIAPRVHNSGHWTIEGAQTSQFENHLRAVMGLPLGATDVLGQVTMINIIGTVPDMTVYENNPHATIHWYHKTERPGRKLAHVTLLE